MRALRLLLLAAPMAALPCVVLAAQPAVAATCASVKVSGSVGSVTLSPRSVTIVVGGCVTYSNSGPLTVRITVGSTSQTAAAGSAVRFTEKKAGTFSVTASQQPAGGSATGSVVVRSRPSPTPTPSRTPSAHPTSAPPASPTPGPGQSTGPQVAASPTVTARPPPTGTPPTASGNSPFLTGQTTPTPTPSPSAAVVAGPLQPATDRGVGLPAALAALLVVGSGGGLLRVLLAEPTERD